MRVHVNGGTVPRNRPCIYGQLIFDKEAEANSAKRYIENISWARFLTCNTKSMNYKRKIDQ